MGMVLVLRRVDATQIADVRKNPEIAIEVAVEDEAAIDAGDCIDFDKAWHALHFLFTGSAGESNAPLSLMRTDGESIGEDVGYGPVQYLSPATIACFRDALSGISDAELRGRFDPDAMVGQDIYLADVFAKEGAESWDYLAQGLPALRTLADRCAATQSGLLSVIT